MDSRLITPTDLAAQLSGSAPPVLVDVRWQLGSGVEANRADYLEGHLPGAAFLDLESTLTDPVAELSSAAEGSAREDVVRSLAARMRAIQREDRLDHLAALGCPVVTWRGSGTRDEVLTRLARRQRVPRVRQS